MQAGEVIDHKHRKLVYVCKHGELKNGNSRKIMLNEDVEAAVFYIDGNYYCLNNECPHNHLRKIHNGFVAKNTVACPMHGWTYSLLTGENIKGGASLESYTVVEFGGNIFVEMPKPKRPKWMDSY
jgi:nitrite reductase/ring-hydroxylating ferredoxin subunit